MATNADKFFKALDFLGCAVFGTTVAAIVAGGGYLFIAAALHVLGTR